MIKIIEIIKNNNNENIEIDTMILKELKVDKHKNNREIAEILNAKRHNIDMLMKKHDLKYKEKDYFFLKDLIDKGYNQKEIAKECGCSESAIRDNLKTLKLYEYFHIKNNTLESAKKREVNYTCCVCGKQTKEGYDVKKYKDNYYCKKHYNHIYRYGEIIEKTVYDKNDYVEKDSYIEIILRDKYQKQNSVCLVNKEDYSKVKNYKWYLSHGYAKTKGINKNSGISIHNVIMDNIDMQVIYDHINKNKLDNRKSNLRIVTHQENAMNMGKKCTNTSGVTGVKKYDKDLILKWDAGITFGYQNINLGRYTNFDEAVLSRLKGEIKYFKEYSPNYNKETNTILLEYKSQEDGLERIIELSMNGNILQNKIKGE